LRFFQLTALIILGRHFPLPAFIDVEPFTDVAFCSGLDQTISYRVVHRPTKSGGAFPRI
jgi:hypothetical protein